MTDPLPLAERLAACASAVPAVTDLYPTAPLAARLLPRGVAGHPPLVRVREADGVMEVLVAVGLAEGAAAPAAGAAVRAAIEQELDAVGVVARRVTVRVATIG